MVKHDPIWKFSRTWLPWGYTAHYEQRVALESPLELTALAAPLVSNVVAPLLASPTVTDVRGRTATQPLLPLNESPAVRGEELCSLGGVVIESGSIENRSLDQPFSIRVYTHFQEFVEPHHIRHSITLERDGALPSELPLALVPVAMPIQLTALRFGIECFQSRRFTGLLGFAPTAWLTLSVEASATELIVALSAEGMRQRALASSDLPPYAWQALDALGVEL